MRFVNLHDNEAAENLSVSGHQKERGTQLGGRPHLFNLTEAAAPVWVDDPFKIEGGVALSDELHSGVTANSGLRFPPVFIAPIQVLICGGVHRESEAT
nr:hypothetical protein [Neorhizobium xiangyangii]